MRTTSTTLILVLGLACNRNREHLVVAASAASAPSQQEISIPHDASKEDIQSLIDKPTSNPPSSSSCKAWLEVQEVSPDLAQWGFGDDLGTYSQFRAYPVRGGKPTTVSKLGRIDTLPEPANSCAPIAVYLIQDDWLLVHSDLGWYWIYCPLNRLAEMDSGNFRKDALSKWECKPKLETEYVYDPPRKPDDWIEYHGIARIKPVNGERLRSAPGLDSKDSGPVQTGYLRFLEFNGDWVKVQESLEIGWIPSAPDHSDILKVRWNPKRIGWIRWRIPGPIPGTFHQLFRGGERFGIID